jgi:hypothetical protein
MSARSILFAAFIFLTASNPPALAATTWYVDSAVSTSGDGKSWGTAFKTIQNGIDASLDGDTVLVAEGTYVESVQFNGKNIVLTSTDPLDPYVVAGTIIDGNGAWSVVAFSGTETEACTLSGFTISKANVGIIGSTWPDPPTHATIENNTITGLGCGVAGCAGIIQNNTITGNRTTYGGGLSNCDGIIRNNMITGNSALDGGGGLYACDGLIENNTITGNWQEGYSGAGGGLLQCGGTIQNNTIVGNSARGSGGGLSDCGGTIQNNTISGNSAFYNGGGLSNCDGTIRSNTIADNSAGTYGGGLHECGGPIRNCILWGNTATFGPQLYGSSVPSYSCIEGWPGGGLGNIGTNPKFVDATAYDYHLQEGSPCIDTGVNEDWMWTATDLDRNVRIFHGGLSLTVDRGAYEYGSVSTFRITQLLMTGPGGFQLTWASRPGDQYIIWSFTDLTSGIRVLEQTVSSAGDSTSWTDPSPSGSQKFYEIEQM